MCLKIDRINHDRLRLCLSRGQSIRHPGEEPFGAPALPTIVERLVWTAHRASAALFY
ncbi:hypothetical protein JK184_04160 [Gluconobacter cerinus]|nr:hypothetical protein [Gluconobacter cerinus]